MRGNRAARAILTGMLAGLGGLVLPASGLAAAGPRAPVSGGSPAAAAGRPADAPAASAPPSAAPAGGAVVLWGEAGLSPAQSRQLQRIARAARRWRAALPALQAAARQQDDTALLDELATLDALLRQLAGTQRLTLAAYLAALSDSDRALSLWAADAAALAPDEQEAGQQVETGAADLTTAADTGFVFSADLGAGTALTYAEGPPPGGAGAAAGDAGPGGADAADGGASGEGDAGGGGMPVDPESPLPGGAGGPAAPAPVDAIDTSGRSGAEGADLAGVGEGDASLPAVATLGAGAVPVMGQGGSAEEGQVAAKDAAGGSGNAGNAGAAGSGWVVIRGGPDSRWQPEGSAAAMDVPMLARQTGDPPDGDLTPADAAAPLDDDPAGAATAFEWEEICRPWQPDTGTVSICPASALPPPGAIAP
jgi:hypothetical protein